MFPTEQHEAEEELVRCNQNCNSILTDFDSEGWLDLKIVEEATYESYTGIMIAMVGHWKTLPRHLAAPCADLRGGRAAAIQCGHSRGSS